MTRLRDDRPEQPSCPSGKFGNSRLAPVRACLQATAEFREPHEGRIRRVALIEARVKSLVELVDRSAVRHRRGQAEFSGKSRAADASNCPFCQVLTFATS